MDYDTLDRPPGGDFIQMFFEVFTMNNIKIMLFIVFIFLIVNSDVFITKTLSNFTDAVEYKMPTTYGTVIQSMFMAVFYMIAVSLIQQKII